MYRKQFYERILLNYLPNHSKIVDFSERIVIVFVSIYVHVNCGSEMNRWSTNKSKNKKNIDKSLKTSIAFYRFRFTFADSCLKL